MTLELFARGDREALAPGAWLFRGFALAREGALRAAIDTVVAEAPLRHMITPGGFRMSVAMTNCGSYGWVSDERGYRYSATDPDTGRAWPALPAPPCAAYAISTTWSWMPLCPSPSDGCQRKNQRSSSPELPRLSTPVPLPRPRNQPNPLRARVPTAHTFTRTRIPFGMEADRSPRPG